MTHLKKSLAVLLAFVMIFSTMSIAASAFDATVDGGFDIGFIRADVVLAAGCVRVKIMLHNCSLQKDAPAHVDGASFA